MAVAAEALPQQLYAETDHYLYEYDNASTWLAEVLDGSMRTSFEFRFDGRELYGHDGTPLGKVFTDSLQDAERLADTQPNLVFELRRRHIEKQEYADMLAMARGQAPNTMIVISDFPPELMDAKEDIGGYNVSRKQTMLRVITWQDGKLKMTSQSLDHSDRQAFEAIYTHCGLRPEPGELLGQRIFTETSSEEQPYIIDRLTGIYDRALTTQYGGNWYAGRRGEQRRNTYDFVRDQHDLLDYFVTMRLRDTYEAEDSRYGLAAAMVERFKGRRPQGAFMAAVAIREGSGFIGGIPVSSVQSELMQAGREARAQGKVFSGCGASVRASGETGDTAEQLAESGYGNKTNDAKESDYKFDKKTYCVVCQRPPKKGDQQKMCGPCGICRTCDRQLKRKGGG